MTARKFASLLEYIRYHSYAPLSIKTTVDFIEMMV